MHNDLDEEEQNLILIRELDNILCDETDRDIEIACEAVFGIKLLLALESKYKKLLNSSKREAK
jgi:hypothetical protein